MATARQKKAIQILVENGGKSVSGAMREAGYSPRTAKNPDKLTKSEAWDQLVDKQISDEKIVVTISEGMEANRVISAVNTGKQASGATSDFIEVPDHAVRHKFVETALKIKGKLVERKDITSDGNEITPLLVKFIEANEDNAQSGDDNTD